MVTIPVALQEYKLMFYVLDDYFSILIVMPAPKDWNPEKITSWVHEFIEIHGHIPHMRDMDNSGPNSRNRKIYGGVAGVLAAAGISAVSYGVRRHHNKTSLISEVKSWSESHGPTDRQLQQADLHVAREAGLLSFHPDTIGNHFESWKEFLIEAGFAKYHWTPSECVQFARTLSARYEYGKLAKLVDSFGIYGRTPDYQDILSYYPDIKSFMRERIRWENWQPKKERLTLTSHWIGYAVLALARADGDTTYITKEMDAMAKIGLGPAYDLDLIGAIDPTRNKVATGIWLQDQAAQIHDGITRSERPGAFRARIHPLFIPEIDDLEL
jgi:hypothetical protein